MLTPNNKIVITESRLPWRLMWLFIVAVSLIIGQERGIADGANNVNPFGIGSRSSSSSSGGGGGDIGFDYPVPKKIRGGGEDGGRKDEQAPPSPPDISLQNNNDNNNLTGAPEIIEKDDSSFSSSSHHPRILREDIVHNGWRKLVNRKVQLPKSGTVVDFEIVSQGDRGGTVSDEAVLVFVWRRSTQTAVLIREYMPSIHGFLNGLAAGMVEQKHAIPASDATRTLDDEKEVTNTGDVNSHPIHSAVETAARHELEEECRLRKGEWIRLCAPTVVDKYMTTRVSAFLVIDPIAVPENKAKPRDVTEEGMQVVEEGMTVAHLQHELARGNFTVMAGWAIQLALTKLREMGEID